MELHQKTRWSRPLHTPNTHTHTRTHVLSTCRVRPETSPQVANLSAPSGRPRAETTPHLPFTLPRARPSPGGSLGRGGAGPAAGGPSPGAGRGPGGGGVAGGAGGGAGGRRGGVPPSLALPGKVSRCCRAQPRLLLLLPRPVGGDCAPTSARAAPPRPPARQHGHHRHLHPLHRRLPALRGARQVRLARRPPGPPHPAPAARALCGSSPRPPALHQPLQRPLGPPHPQPFPPAASGGPVAPSSLPRSALRALQQLPGLLHPALPPGLQPLERSWAPPAPPLLQPSGAPHPDPTCSLPPSHSVQELIQHPVLCPTRLALRTLPGPAAPTPLRCPGVGGCLVPGPAPG